MLKILAAVAVSLVALHPGDLFAQGASPNLSGTYRCTPEPSSCDILGQTFTVTQSGNNLDMKSDKGEVGRGTLTSDISLTAGPPWNMHGTILPDRTIQWSNGTKWQKQ